MSKPATALVEAIPPASDSAVRDYERVVRAIEYLRRHATGQPDLAAVARHVHLSEHHFQRLFTRWAGVSPKRFLQYLTVEYAKTCLARTRNILDLTADAGLSSPGRLHDLFVTLEAASPGEIRSGGAGLQIRYGIHDSPFGACLIAISQRGVCAVRFIDAMRDSDAATMLREEWPRAGVVPDPASTSGVAKKIFEPLATQHPQPLALLVKGTNFQLQVWRALLEVPFGHVTSYRDVAKEIGHPAAARAVGNAIGTNPIACLIPCHRVIRESGTFGRYRWGEERKAAILGWEAARCSVDMEL